MRALSHRETRITVAGSSLCAVEIDGGGPTVLMLRGLSRSRRFWLDVDLRLAERGFRVVTLDHRGIGQSTGGLTSFGLDALADDAAAVMAALGHVRFGVFGISLGGMVAQHLALRHGAQVERLALGATTPGGPLARRIAPRAAASLLLSLVLPRRTANETAARVVLSETHRRTHPETLEAWARILAEEPVRRRVVVHQLLAAARHDASAQVGTLRMPVLLLCGDADVLISPDNTRLLERLLPHAEVTWFRGAGHDFPTERPAETVDALAGFFAATRPSGLADAVTVRA